MIFSILLIVKFDNGGDISYRLLFLPLQLLCFFLATGGLLMAISSCRQQPDALVNASRLRMPTDLKPEWSRYFEEEGGLNRLEAISVANDLFESEKRSGRLNKTKAQQQQQNDLAAEVEVVVNGYGAQHAQLNAAAQQLFADHPGLDIAIGL